MSSSTFAPLERLDGRVAVIAGGTGAIGWASARRLAALGARCVLLYLHDDPAEAEAKAAALPGERAPRAAGRRSPTATRCAPPPRPCSNAAARCTCWSTARATPSRCRPPTWTR